MKIMQKYIVRIDTGGTYTDAVLLESTTHDLVTEKAISLIDPKPVFCSHRISRQAGMQERAATAGLHAKLMPIMQDYMTGVREAMTERHLHCPMAVIAGNGTIVSSTKAVEQTGLTVASGPACTAFFGSLQSNTDNLVIDRTEEKIENLVIEYIFNRFWGKTLTNFISTRNSHPVLQVAFSLRIPLIGIGAAARFFLPGVAARLSTTVTFPENYAVGNAIGAAMICEKAFIMKEAQ